jgi:hypothetical protein
MADPYSPSGRVTCVAREPGPSAVASRSGRPRPVAMEIARNLRRVPGIWID